MTKGLRTKLVYRIVQQIFPLRSPLLDLKREAKILRIQQAQQAQQHFR